MSNRHRLPAGISEVFFILSRIKTGSDTFFFPLKIWPCRAAACCRSCIEAQQAAPLQAFFLTFVEVSIPFNQVNKSYIISKNHKLIIVIIYLIFSSEITFL
jgi:hypothetical protein